MILKPLRPGQHGIIVGDDNALGCFFVKQSAIDTADTSDHAVCRGASHQVIQRATLPLGRNDHRPVLDVGIGVTDVVHVLTCGALAGLPPPCNRLGPGGVHAEFMPLNDLSQVRTDIVEVNVGRFFYCRHRHLGLFDKGKRMAFKNRVSLTDGQLADNAARFSCDHMLHLHGFHDEELLADVHLVAFTDVQTDNRPLERSRDGHGPVRTAHLDGWCLYGRSRSHSSWRARRLAMLKHG